MNAPLLRRHCVSHAIVQFQPAVCLHPSVSVLSITLSQHAAFPPFSCSLSSACCQSQPFGSDALVPPYQNETTDRLSSRVTIFGRR